MKSNRIDLRAQELYDQARTYGELEHLAGVRDRPHFWHNKTEAEARSEMRKLIRDRVQKGELQ